MGSKCITNLKIFSRHLELELKHDYEQGYDFNTIRSLNFPQETTATLYDKINKHYIKIFIPNFAPVQTNCSKRNWEKLVKLQAMSSTPLSSNYYLAVRHTIGRTGREIVVGSPLQVSIDSNLTYKSNRICFIIDP